MRSRPGRGREGRALPGATLVDVAATVFAAPPDLPRARQMPGEGSCEAAYELLVPLEADSKGDAEFNLLLGESALRSQRAEQAETFFERSLAAAPSSVDAHLGLRRANLALGAYARATIKFEAVLRFAGLPPDLHQRAEIYADAAPGRAEGKGLLASGCAMVEGGNYRMNATPDTNAFGGNDTNDNVVSARFGGNLNAEPADANAPRGSLDYRNGDNAGRRDDSDLRCEGTVRRPLGKANLPGGLRGRVSYRGDGQYRNDRGLYGSYRFRLNAGREFNTECADGKSSFFGLSPAPNYSFNDQWGASSSWGTGTTVTTSSVSRSGQATRSSASPRATTTSTGWAAA